MKKLYSDEDLYKNILLTKEILDIYYYINNISKSTKKVKLIYKQFFFNAFLLQDTTKINSIFTKEIMKQVYISTYEIIKIINNKYNIKITVNEIDFNSINNTSNSSKDNNCLIMSDNNTYKIIVSNELNSIEKKFTIFSSLATIMNSINNNLECNLKLKNYLKELSKFDISKINEENMEIACALSLLVDSDLFTYYKNYIKNIILNDNMVKAKKEVCNFEKNYTSKKRRKVLKNGYSI